MVQKAHAGEARLGHLRRADRVEHRRDLETADRIVTVLAPPLMEKIRLTPISRAEIEMAAVMRFEKARRAKVGIVADAVDIGPEVLRTLRHTRFARKVHAALDQRRGEGEVEADKHVVGLLEQPAEDGRPRPVATRRVDERWRSTPLPAHRQRNSGMTVAFRARPVDRCEAGETAHFLLRGRGGFFARACSAAHSIMANTRSGSSLP